MLSPLLSLEDPGTFCTIKLDVVLNLKRSSRDDYDHDIKDEVSKSCKEFREKQKFKRLLDDLRDSDGGDDLEKTQKIQDKLLGFDSEIGKGISEKMAPPPFKKKKDPAKSAESQTDKAPKENLVKLISS